jgi:hypothetical protein
MKHTWVIEPIDIQKVKGFLDLHRDDVSPENAPSTCSEQRREVVG